MRKAVIDASVAVKWVITEDGSDEAVSLRGVLQAMAPELLIAECANILWRKAQRSELSSEHARLALRVLRVSDIELRPMRPLIEHALDIALDLTHPVYDCLYVALALAQDAPFVTADARLLRRVEHSAHRDRVIGLNEAAAAWSGSAGNASV